ncbi:MAG: B12 binding domain protein [candidate division TA06 bacterium ADurb.Bin417]|uniref:B12 binding domain protein n=1 Tax=candidate division TA06 bacterium ADurb.Bin417 TaxID=1852828 RepID=A0A1V5MK40_UNCT6|nr:MAG: B12 binding domain protein [candidate division TA06 bacterium ADurb.Bin417]
MRIIIPAYPAFNIYTHIARRTTALGPICVATVVHELPGWDVEVIDENNLAGYGPRGENGGADHDFLQRLRPADAVGFYGGLTSTIPRLLKLAGFYRRQGVLTVAGGQHFCAETAAEGLAGGLDYIVLGEGETTIRELLSVLDAGGCRADVKGLAYLENGKIVFTPPREPVTDFDRLPLPDFSLVRNARISLYPVERIRGCGMDCEFCAVKGKFRSAAPERLLAQISYLLETRAARHFFIVDDLFGQQREETLRFCGLLRDYQREIGRRLDLTVQIRLDKARDSELLSAMRQAGINTVCIGFESPIPEELTAMRKHVQPGEMVELARIFHRFGFLVHGMFIFGYPLESGADFQLPLRKRIKRYRDFVRRARIDTLQVLLPVPLPDTELRRRLQAQNRVYPTVAVGWEYYDGNFPLFEPDPPLRAEDLQAALRSIMGKFYQLRYLPVIGWNALSFSGLLFFLHDIRFGWRQWYRSWRNTWVRFGGWIIFTRWIRAYEKGDFSRRLLQARAELKKE